MWHLFFSLLGACLVTHVVGAAVLWKFTRVSTLKHPTDVYYVAADLTKASVLALGLCMPSCWDTAAALFHTARCQAVVDWGKHGPVVTAAVLSYAVTDASQFLTVYMSRSTLLHHTVTTAFGLYMCAGRAADAPLGPLTIALLWYGLWSSVAYLVNASKALRKVVAPNAWTEHVRVLALVLYGFELAVNWMGQLVQIFAAVYLHDVHVVSVALYCWLIHFLVIDDWKLLRFMTLPGTAASAHRPVNRAWNAMPIPYGVQCILGLFTRSKRLGWQGKTWDPAKNSRE